MSDPIGIGIDVGSSGARVIAAGAGGRVLAAARGDWPLRRAARRRHEQDPELWWSAIMRCLREVTAKLSAAQRAAVLGVSATATSGTLVVADAALRPLRPALMWDDQRAAAEAEECGAAGAALCAELGYRFRPTFSLPKMLWIARHEPRIWQRVEHVAHATDWLTGRLRGDAPVCDHTNALKSGYDLIRERWPSYIERLGIDRTLLPPVVPAGTPVGTLDARIAAETGLPAAARVVAGMTDANTAQVAGGAFGVGQWVTTIGTGLSLKGVSRTLIKDPRGVLYCHRHPDGHWIPTGTSHSGADAIAARFPGEDLDRLTAAAAARGPARALVFPLPRTGEFFPFWAPQAQGFTIGEIGDRAELFRACLEGIAFIERLSHETVTRLGAQITGPVTTVGGGSRSALWRQIRADVLARPVRMPRCGETALGAAVVALAAERGGIAAAAGAAAGYVGRCDPRPGAAGHYAERYAAFRAALVERGYLDPAAGREPEAAR